MSGTVNTGFIFDMQHKLYRWSAANPEKKFADLFNTERMECRTERMVPERRQIRFVSLVENGTHVLFSSQMAGYTTGEITLAKSVLASWPGLKRSVRSLRHTRKMAKPPHRPAIIC